MIRKHYFLSGLLFLSLLVGAHAQEIWLRNRPFEGKVLKESGQLWLEVESFGKALGFSYELKDDGVTINGKLVRSLTQGTRVFVPLTQSAAVLGAVVKENPEFDTVDVHLDVKPSRGAGLDVDLTKLPKEAKPVQGQIIKTAAFEFTLPDEMQITRDPSMIKKTLGVNGPDSNPKHRFDAMMYYKGDSRNERGGAVFSWEEFDSPSTDEKTLLSVQRRVMLDNFTSSGIAPINVPPYLTNKGQTFAMLMGLVATPPHDAFITLTRIDPKKHRLYTVTVVGLPYSDETSAQAFMGLLRTITTR